MKKRCFVHKHQSIQTRIANYDLRFEYTLKFDSDQVSLINVQRKMMKLTRIGISWMLCTIAIAQRQQ